jgi:uncharacterized protein
MAIPPRATPRTNGKHHVDGSHRNGAGHARADVSALPVYHPQRAQEEPRRVHYSHVWLGLGATTAALGLLGLRRYGRPWLAGAGALGALSLAYMTIAEPARPVLERVTLQLPALPAQLDGLRIGQITDSHLGLPHTARNLAWAVAQMRAERPELLVITGDLVSTRRAIPDLPALLRELAAPLGIYAIPGNHDHWEGLHDLRAALSLLGIPLLMNEHRRLRWNGADLWLVGIDDIWDGQPDIAAALQGVPRDGFKVLLAHAPDAADEAAGQGFALQLSGHTHGGHMRLPLLGPFTRPRFGERYVMGSYQVGAMALYVSRGLGGAPLRLLCRPEATIITLRRG